MPKTSSIFDFKLPWIFLLFMAPFTQSNCQEIGGVLTTDSVLMQTWIVSAQRLPNSRENAPYAVQIVHNSDLEANQVRTTAEAVWYMPSVFLQKTNHGGGAPIIRGLMGNQIGLLYDGIRINNATYRYGPNQYFNTINVFDLSKLELLNGGSSVQFGSDALGGVLHAHSEALLFSDAPIVQSKSLFRSSSKGMEQTGFHQLVIKDKNTAMTAAITLRNFGDLYGGDTTRLQSPSGYSELDFNFKAKFRLGSRLEATALTQKVRQEDVDVFHKVRLEQFEQNKMEHQSRALSYLKLRYFHRLKNLRYTNITVYQQHTLEKRSSQKVQSPINSQEQDEVKTWGFSVENYASFLKNGYSTTGLEVYGDFVKSARFDFDRQSQISSVKRGLYPNASRSITTSIFSLHDYFLRKSMLSAGLRWSMTQITLNELGKDAVRIQPNALVGNFSINYPIQSHIWLNASINSSFRSPNIDDLSTLGIVDFRYEIPNFGLKPERAIQQQLGLKLTKPKWQWSIFTYQNNLQNLIERIRVDTQTIQGYPVFAKTNYGSGVIRGVESNLTLLFWPRLTVKTGLTWTYGQNKVLDQPLRRIPPLFSSLKVQFKCNQMLGFTAEGFAAGRQTRLSAGDKADNRIPAGGTPAWGILNVHADLKLAYTHVQLSLLNITNKDYRTHGSGINGVGRSITATVTFAF